MSEFPSPLTDYIARIRRMLEDTADVDTLNSNLTSSDTSITVTTPRLVGKGALLEIGEEVLYTLEDMSGFTVPVRRGFKFTTPATHSIGDTIIVNPRYERSNIKEAINVVLGDWISFYSPRLVWDTTTAGAFQASRDIYACPTDAINCRRVTWKNPGRVQLIDVEHGPLEPFDTTIVSTGVGVEVFEHGLYGSTVRLLLEKAWPFLTLDADTVPADFPAMMDYLITDGAVLYLLGWRLAPRSRMEETMFVREAASQLPPNFSEAALQMMQRNWQQGVHRMMNMRAQPTKPRRVIRD